LSEITTHLKKVRSKIVVFEGWEPTLDPNLSEIASTLRRELKTQNLLLTNGYLLPKLDGIDEVKISLKALSEKIHIEYTGKSNRQVLENFKLLCQSGKRVSAETVLVPGYVDREEIGRIAKFIASIDEGIPLRIDSYWPIASKKWRRPTYEEMREAMREARKHLRKVSSVVGNEPVLGEVKVVG
jgi:pyruvate-formate lyase-activating enzyme